MKRVIKVTKILKKIEGTPSNKFYVLSTDGKVLAFSINISLWSNPVVELRRDSQSYHYVYRLYYRQTLARRFMSLGRSFPVRELNEQEILEELL